MGTEDEGSSVTEPGIACTTDEARCLWAALRDHFGGRPKTLKTPELVAVLEKGTYFGIRLRSSLEISVRQHRTKGTWFLNIRGNYGALTTGQNAFGDVSATVEHTAKLFNLVLNLLGRAATALDVSRLREAVRRLDIYIHDLAFAGYTTKITHELGLQRLIRHLYARYSTFIVRDGEGEVSLLQMLNLRRTDGEQYADSIPLVILNGGKKLMHLCAYNKAEQMREAGHTMVAVTRNDLSSRLRLDLTVDARYFELMWRIPRSRMTLRSLQDYVQKRWDGDWRKACLDLLGYALRRTCLFYMFGNWPNMFAEEHSAMRARWEAEHARGRGANNSFSPEVKQWAEKHHIDPRVSPDAHLCMMLGEAQTEVNTRNNVAGAYQNDVQFDAYSARLKKSIRRRQTSVHKVVRELAVDMSSPAYEEPVITFKRPARA